LELGVDGPRLVGGRCEDCDRVGFPLRERCTNCGGTMRRELLPQRGTLWTWTTQGFEPKPPYVGDGEFEPYAVGYVELPGYLRVEGRLTEADPARLRIGMDVELVALERPSGVTYAFAPV
jgi:uncharacterized OB-fold protein